MNRFMLRFYYSVCYGYTNLQYYLDLGISSENLMRNILAYVSIARPFLLAQGRFLIYKYLFATSINLFLYLYMSLSEVI